MPLSEILGKYSSTFQITICFHSIFLNKRLLSAYTLSLGYEFRITDKHY